METIDEIVAIFRNKDAISASKKIKNTIKII